MSNPADPADCPAAHVTLAGADWLASASCFPRSVHALWALRPTAPSVLPCGTAFDVVSASQVDGRRLLDRLWSAGPGSGPVAVHQGRMLLFCAPGTAGRLPALLDWEEWGSRRADPRRETGGRRLLCHGAGDTVTVPPLSPAAGSVSTSRWLVAPDVRHPWLPGPEMLLWAYVRAYVRPGREVRRPHPRGPGGPPGRGRVSIFFPQDRGAKVYDVSRRR
ncbi:hypothetical protein RM572_03265 [Streptomyces sp. DSM 42041]|uniref:DNA primase/polymerase bifunctional N-terminal domain-containing protein n=1 Tax=Streptomyces hazeniae TaxID=3075538 RepID=A0ABU2NM37_9ACTN|nr:hypothetical protein [Streptomyces sp. DSM 42041]MDT0377794.1 hypothetical protein [Streptomyces sp. DSM 42041]